MQVVELEHVVRQFGSTRAVDDLDFAVERGTCCGIVGPSGAGKTTTLRLILSILLPDSGRVSVLGHGSALQARNRIGYLPEERGVYRRMRVMDFLLYIAQLKEVPVPVAQRRATSILARLGLDDVRGRRCEELSKGMLQRVQFVASVVNEPELLILDEPFSGLDPVSVKLLREVIAGERDRGATLLFSTHVMPHAEELCDRVVMIHRGRKALDERTEALRRQFDPLRVLFEPLDPHADIGALRRLPGVAQVITRGLESELHLAPQTDPADILRAAAAAVPAARLAIARVTLEDVFIRVATSVDDPGEEVLRRELRNAAGEVVS